MRFLPNEKMNCGKNEIRAITLLLFIIWLKMYCVDYRIADVLDWPLGNIGSHVIRCILRAAAVGIPSLAAVACVILPVSLASAKYRGRVLLVFDFLISVLVITDTLFIRYYSDIFIFHDLMLVPQTGLIVKSIWSLLKPWDLLFFADIPLILWLSKSGRIQVCFNPLTKHRMGVTAAVILLALCVQLFAGWRLIQHRPNVIKAMYDRLSVCAWVGVAPFHWGDFIALSRTAFRSDDTPDEKIREMREWFSQHGSVMHRPLAVGRNLIMIQCEALQYFVKDLSVNGVEVTPNLNRFSRECVYFANAWNQTAGGQSADSEFMANAGMFPASSGAAYTRFANNDYNSLARNLRANGYRAVVFQGTYSAFWNCHRMHPKLCFEKQYSRSTSPDGEVIGLGLSDRAIFANALSKMKTLKSPFYAFIVTLSSHHPFDFEGLDDGSLPLPAHMKGTLLGNYLVSIHYFDREFGRFIDGLMRGGLLEKTLVVVYGDHPAMPIAYKEEMETLLGSKIETPVDWKRTCRVPLMFRIPGRARVTGVRKTDTGQMDVLPTVAGLLGADVQSVFGKDLFAENSREPVVFRNGSYIINGVFVEPAVGRATNIETGEALNVADYAVFTRDAERRLEYSDLILEHNLIENIIRK